MGVKRISRYRSLRYQPFHSSIYSWAKIPAKVRRAATQNEDDAPILDAAPVLGVGAPLEPVVLEVVPVAELEGGIVRVLPPDVVTTKVVAGAEDVATEDPATEVVSPPEADPLPVADPVPLPEAEPVPEADPPVPDPAEPVIPSRVKVAEKPW